MVNFYGALLLCASHWAKLYLCIIYEVGTFFDYGKMEALRS